MADDLFRPDDPWAVTTYAKLAETVIDRPGGRFAAAETPIVTRLPAPNWSHDPTGPEPPLGYDINEVPDLGFQDAEARRAREALADGPEINPLAE